MAIIITKRGAGAQRVEESGVPQERFLEDYVAANPESLPMDDLREDLRLVPLIQQFDAGSGPIDVLAVDDEGEVYIIETKLFRNPDKRQVVAQVLDYGAALWRQYHTGGNFIADVDAHLQRKQKQTVATRLTDALGVSGTDLDELVASITRNVQQGNLRFVVLMDALHDRLKDLIVFLNERSRFTLYAVEMQFYRYEELEIVIPKMFGAEVATPAAASGRGRWDEASFFDQATKRLDAATLAAIRTVYDGVVELGGAVGWGTGAQSGSFNPRWPHLAQKSLLSVYTDGKLFLNFRWLRGNEATERMRDAYIAKVRDAKLWTLPAGCAGQFISLNPAVWVPKAKQFVEVLREVVSSGY